MYIGVHSTEDPTLFDGYIGCGVNIFAPSTYKKSKTAFQYAVNKYGINCFKRYILAIFDDEQQAYNLEQLIVNEQFIKREDVYNMTIGGKKGPDQSVMVYQYNLSGDYLKTWYSYKDIAKYYKCSTTSIENAVKNCYSSNKFYWTDKKVEKLDLSIYSNGTKRDGKIFEYNSKGKQIGIYNTTKEIANKRNITIGEINRAIQGGYKIKNNYYSLQDVKIFIPKEKMKIKNNPIYLYDESGNFKMEFESPSKCYAFFNEKNSSKISTALRLNRLYNGYQVSIKKVDCMKNYNHKNGKIKIAQYDLNMNLIKIFNSLTDAINEYGQGVRRVVKGQQNTCKNFIFKKVNDIV